MKEVSAFRNVWPPGNLTNACREEFEIETHLRNTEKEYYHFENAQQHLVYLILILVAINFSHRFSIPGDFESGT